MREIALRGKRGRGKFTKVDDENYDWLNQFSWTLDSGGYAQRCTKTARGWRMTRMHRDVLNLKPGEPGDHINRDKLDNQRCNLRKCTTKENTRNKGILIKNTSGFIGVSYDKKQNIHGAYITIDGKRKFLGYSLVKKDLAKIHDLYALKYFGEFASLNFPIKEYEHCNIDEEIKRLESTFGERLRNKKSSKYKGVHWSTSKKSYQVELHFKGEKIRLGSYKSEYEAVLIYDQAVRKYFGSSAKTNFNIHTNLPTSKERRLSLPIDEIVEKYKQGKTVQQLAREYDISRISLTRRFKKLGVHIRSYQEAQLLSNTFKSREQRKAQARAAQIARRKKN